MNERGSQTSFANRRKQVDWVVKAATILSVISWLTAVTVILLLDYASPETDNLMAIIFEVTVRTEWDQAFIPIAFGLLILSLIICVAAFVFNMLRMKRKTDRFKKSIFIIGFLNFIGIWIFVFRFGAYLF